MEQKTYLNRYRLCVDRIGLPVIIRRSADEGTFQADDLVSGGQVALQLEPAPALGAAEREQLEVEARVAQQLNHINIPTLRDFGFDDDQLFYVTEFLEGTTAEDWIKTKGPMPASAVLRIAAQVSSALGAASAHGIIHYAVHPGNIMLVTGQTAEGEWPLVKVLNLVGMAPPLPPPGTNGSAPLNPADFASPEQLGDSAVDFRSEIYSLGCTLWFLLKGQPLAGGVATVQDADGLPAPVRQLLVEMLATNPEDRPSDPVASQQRIQDCLAQIEREDVVANKLEPAPTVPPAPETKIEPLPPRHSAWKPLALAAVLVALATLAAIVWTQQRQREPAAEVAAVVPQAPAVPLVTEPQSADASATDEATKPPIVASDVVAPADTKEQSSSDDAVLSHAEESPAQIAAEDAFASTSSVETAPSVSLEQKSTEQQAPFAEMMASVPLNQESVEQAAPIVASNSSSPDPGMTTMETAPEQLPKITEAPPPAEAPIENEKPTLQSSPAPPIPAANQEVRKDIPIKSPATAPKENSKPVHAAKSPTKKKPVAAAVRSGPLVARRLYPSTSVGHIL
ncbi:MAG: protein kinase domain-containing protein, partial [Chthoniobacterales bacterium]